MAGAEFRTDHGKLWRGDRTGVIQRTTNRRYDFCSSGDSAIRASVSGAGKFGASAARDPKEKEAEELGSTAKSNGAGAFGKTECAQVGLDGKPSMS
jgi:hypothetical protein